MSEIGPIHWHEGLFLQPHHLQLMQRYLLSRDAAAHQWDWSYPYGVVEARLARDALANMLVRFDQLHAIMPDGLEVRVPDSAELEPLDIKRPFEAHSDGFTIYLGVPRLSGTQGNTIEQANAPAGAINRRWRVKEMADVPDENTGDNAQPVQVRRINARLLTDDDDHTGLDTLPLLRVVPAVGEEVGQPRQDPDYVGPCVVLSGAPALRELVRDLADQVKASRDGLVVQLTRGGFSIDAIRGQQIEQMMRLRTLNRFAGRLPSLVTAPNVSPFQIYLELRELLGELAALQPDRDPFATAAYNHDAPLPGFKELSEKIRGLLQGSVAPSYMQLAFQPDGEALIADLEDRHLSGPNQYLLGIKTRQDPRAVAELVEDADKFKFMARSLARSRVRGVKLAEERHPPLGLPASNDLHYFRLMRNESERMWQRIEQEKALSIRWPEMEGSDFSITLFMPLAGGEG